MGLNILVIGNGGREHTIAQKFIQSTNVANVFCAKGNPGMKKDGIQLVEIAEDDHQALIHFVKEQHIDWTFVGPEVPLLNGIVDEFTAAGLLIFGPTKAAAQIEGSKDYAKTIMNRYKIPTAEHKTFSNFEEAKLFVETHGVPIVIKADGLAAGKGVVVAQTQKEAVDALADMLKNNKFGASGAKVVIEEFLSGEEYSLLAFVRGEEVYPMVIAQDHKRAYDNDLGPNTGGMGAYAPVPHIPTKVVQESIERVLLPAAKGMVQEGRSFTGILYAGLIATENGPKVIEFNARFGDPETQVVLQRLTSDLADIIDKLLKGKQPTITWKRNGVSLGVVVAAKGYPDNYKKNIVLPTIKPFKNGNIYYAGVEEQGDSLVSSGGRIYLLEASAASIEEARQIVYDKLDSLTMSETFYRHDIGMKGI